MRTLAETGEFGWIGIAKKFCSGIGDDAAVLPWTGKKDLLLTTDMLLEGRHFTRRDAGPSTPLGASAYEIGWKAMAVNISDIAAMAGTPLWAVVALGAPASCKISFLKELYRGMRSAAGRFGVKIVGGDTNASKRLAIAVTLLGEVEKGKAVPRSGARAGDRIFVSGKLGGSYRSKKHLRFTPRVKEARWLAKNFRVHAMMDLSDGLASDVRRIAEQSGVGVRLKERCIPASAGVSVRQALTDGEDFELLFTLPVSEARKLQSRKAPHGFPKFTCVGEIVPKRKDRRPKLSGFDHFR